MPVLGRKIELGNAFHNKGTLSTTSKHILHTHLHQDAGAFYIKRTLSTTREHILHTHLHQDAGAWAQDRARLCTHHLRPAAGVGACACACTSRVHVCISVCVCVCFAVHTTHVDTLTPPHTCAPTHQPTRSLSHTLSCTCTYSCVRVSYPYTNIYRMCSLTIECVLLL